jgi:hypothetical protein
VLDVTFSEDAARFRTGNGPQNTVIVRHFAINMVRGHNDKRSIKLRRNKAARNPAYRAIVRMDLRHFPIPQIKKGISPTQGIQGFFRVDYRGSSRCPSGRCGVLRVSSGPPFPAR